MAGAGHCGIDNNRLRLVGGLDPCPFEADGPASVDHDVQQTAHHGDVLHEMDHLILGLGGGHGPEVAEVRIMSLHKSKGLSAPVTFIAGCVEGLLPMSPKPSLSPQARVAFIEEQRRLFYVGISRVKALPQGGKPGTLILTYSQQMPLSTAMSAGISPAGVYYGTANLNASRFIAELGPSAPPPTVG